MLREIGVPEQAILGDMLDIASLYSQGWRFTELSLRQPTFDLQSLGETGIALELADEKTFLAKWGVHFGLPI